jgi:hypothetical protein
VRILWDEPKRLTNLANRGLNFESLDLEFFAAAVVVPSRNRRYKAIGWLDGRPLAVIFQPLGTEALSVISMRRASRKERMLL